MFSISFSEINATENLKVTEQLLKEQKQLIKLNLNDLLNLQVTSVSKKTQDLSKSAAAIFVITYQDIKKSGVTSIPEALRMAPGIDVAKIDGNKWAITSRGFNSRFANKLLVLIDGRSVYTPFFSGVHWDTQDILLEDINRIEVIRGPGAALWGANAVNGVINIISKTAAQTQGSYAMAGGGSSERVFAGFRYGGKFKESLHYRVYGKYFERENNEDLNKQAVNDEWRVGRGGFRLDWNATTNDKLTLQGDIYNGDIGETLTLPSNITPTNSLENTDAEIAGGNILLRWNKQITQTESTTFQLYYDYTDKDNFWLQQEHNTLDIDFLHVFDFSDKQDISWGAGYRFISDHIEGSFLITPKITSIDTHLFNFFIQNEITLIPEKLTLTLGSKFEHNDYSGFEIQPSANIIWTPTAKQSVWGSISRAVRTSARAEQGGVINQQFINGLAPLPVLISLRGGIDDASEEVIAFQLGYRIKPLETLSFDVAIFYNIYDNLVNFHPADSLEFAGTHLIQPLFIGTDMAGETVGAELAVSWQALDNLQINAIYSYLQMQLHTKNGTSTLSEVEEKQSPHHKFSIRSSLKLLPSLDWNLWFRYVDSVPAHNIPSYFTMDTRLAWQPINSLELSVTGQNLLDSQHPEFDSNLILTKPSQTARGVYGKIEWRF